MYTTHMYATYVLASLAMTIWVARTLHRSGRPFLIESFRGNAELADSVNRLLVVGFYLVNVGFILMWLRADNDVATLRDFMEVLSRQLGVVLLVLGAMHFMNLAVFTHLRSRRLADDSGYGRPDGSHSILHGPLTH